MVAMERGGLFHHRSLFPLNSNEGFLYPSLPRPLGLRDTVAALCSESKTSHLERKSHTVQTAIH